MNAIRLKTEYLKNPIGMDIVKPRLFWNCAEGVRQTAYRIVCRDEHENVLWDSGRGGKLLHAGGLCGCAVGKPHPRCVAGAALG